MAVGQYLDVGGAAGDPQVARRAAALKGGSYTVEGPLLIGAALAGGSPAVTERLSRFGGRSARRSSSATTWRTARRRRA